MTALQRIKQEYGEPFKETIRAYATMGYSRRAVAQILEVSQTTGLRLIKRYNCGQYFKTLRDMRPECKGKGWIKGRARNGITGS